VAEQREWLGPEELAARYDIPIKTTYVWNSKGTGPRYARFGRHVRYALRDVEAWEQQQYGEPRPAA